MPERRAARGAGLHSEAYKEEAHKAVRRLQKPRKSKTLVMGGHYYKP
jgi:hypothetical protein